MRTKTDTNKMIVSGVVSSQEGEEVGLAVGAKAIADGSKAVGVGWCVVLVYEVGEGAREIE